MWTDLRHALRSLAQTRSVIALSILCLAIGIGVVTMVFSVVNGLLMQPLPFRDPEQLLEVTAGSLQATGDAGPVSGRDFDIWQRLQLPVELAAMRAVTITASRSGDTERLPALAVTWNLPDLLGIRPIAGRTFRSDDDRAGADGAVLMSESLWQSAFASDPFVIGRSLVVNGRGAMVIGIVPQLAHPALPGSLRAAEIWAPRRWLDQGGADDAALTVIARSPAAGDGQRVAELQARLDSALASESARRDRVVRVGPMDLSASPTTRAMLVTAMGAATFVLLIGCANVANLMLLRSAARQREMATRVALGASRPRIVRQLLLESALVGLASAPVGLLLGWAGRNVLLGADAAQANVLLPIDWRVAAAAGGAALLTSVLFGLAPVVQSLRASTRNLLGDGGREATPGRLQHRLQLAFATSEIVLSLVLLVGTSLLARSFANLLDADRDLDLARLVVVGLGGPEDRQEVPHETARVTEEIQARVGALPGIASTALAEFMPLRRGGPRVGVRPDGHDAAAPPQTILQSAVSAEFFATMGMAIEVGRPFTSAEARAGEAVAVVNRRAADRFWPGQNAVGQRIRLDSDPTVVYVVVGVTQNISNWDVNGQPLPSAYVPLPELPQAPRVLIVRPAGDPAAVMAPVRDIVASFDRTRRGAEPQLMETISRDAFSRQRTLAVLFSVFSGLSLLLTVVGVYGVLSCFVSQRRRELGIRAALGAGRGALVWAVGRLALVAAGRGIAIGILLAMGATRVLQRMLFEVSATDPLSYNVPVFLILAVSALAAWAPAYRAASADPAASLRE